MGRREIPHDPRHLGVPSVASKMISEPMVRSTWTVHLSCIKNSTTLKLTELSHEPYHLGVHQVWRKWFLSQWYVGRKLCTDVAPTLTLSPNGKNWDSTRPTSPRSSIRCVQTIPEPMVRSTQTVHLSCVKISTSPKGPIRASTWASSPSGIIECIQNDFWAYGTSSANHAPILHRE
jgi:hypothetical protein